MSMLLGGRSWAKGFFLCFLLTLIFACSFVIFVLKNAPLEKLEKSIVSEQKLQELRPPLQRGALIHFADFQTYYLFSRGQKPLPLYMQKLRTENALTRIGQKLALLERKIELEPLYKNHCEQVYCYQHRISFREIPSVFWKGLIGIEDARFLQHTGVDYFALARALFVDLVEMKFVQGGSTLTQQLVKNLFLTNEKTVMRKIKELIISLYIETKFTKEKILEAYFNEVFWGVLQGVKIKGVYAGALFYFGKKINEITPYEAVILTAMLKGPNYYNPILHLPRLKKRVESVFNRLLEKNKISKKFSKVWSSHDWKKWQQKLRKEKEKRPYHELWHVARSYGQKDYLSAYEQFVLARKGQKLLSRIKKKLDKKDLAIKIMLGNAQKKGHYYTFYSKKERSKKKALENERHQVGSTLKPIIYSLFNDFGKQFSDLVSTEKLTLKLISGKWSPKESHNPAKEKITLMSALEKSYNSPVIRLAQEIGFEKMAVKLGEKIPYLKKPLSEYPAQLLGAVELSVHDLYQSYQKFIEGQCQKAPENNLLLLMSNPNRSTVRKIVGARLKKLDFFGKTGTSNRGMDNWYVFYVGKELGVIWIGMEGKRLGPDLKLYGGSTSFRLFEDFFMERGKRFDDMRCALPL